MFYALMNKVRFLALIKGISFVQGLFIGLPRRKGQFQLVRVGSWTYVLNLVPQGTV